MTLKQVVEALVFASPKPLTTKEIQAALKSAGNPEKTQDPDALAFAKMKEDDLLTILAEIQADLVASGRSFQLMEQVNGWSFVTDPSAVHWVRQLYPEAKPTRLSGPQLETLAIIAYRQPVTRADIEAVRGVAVDGVVQVLMERSLIKIAGRADVPGRPLLYETTQYFLQHFGLKTVGELPNAHELRKIELPKAEVPTEEKPAEGEEQKPAEGKTGSRKKKDKTAAAMESGATPEKGGEASPAPEEQAAVTESSPDAEAPVEDIATDLSVPTDPIEEPPLELSAEYVPREAEADEFQPPSTSDPEPDRDEPVPAPPETESTHSPETTAGENSPESTPSHDA